VAGEPLDVLFFRDGRPFGEATRARSGLPTPQVFCGAVRNWLLRQHDCDFHKLEPATQKCLVILIEQVSDFGQCARYG